MTIDDVRWMMYHFEGDALERESIRLTVEILKTVTVILFGIIVAVVV